MPKTAEDTGKAGNMLRVTLIHSPIATPKVQKATCRALGLGKLHRTVVLPDNPQIRGMVRKVSHLLKVEEIVKAAGEVESAGASE